MSADQQPDEVDAAWQHIAGLQLRLLNTVYFYQHYYRDQPWLIIADQQDENYFRCSINAEPFLNLLDGFLSVEQALEKSQQSSEPSLTHHDVVMLMANLENIGLLQLGVGGTTDSKINERANKKTLTQKQSNPWLRPFAIKFALFDPDQWLEKMAHYVKPLFGLWSLVLWCLLVFVALVVSWLHWPQLLEHGQSRLNDPTNLLWYWLLYPVIKMCHELGHAFATKVWGGVVHEMGIMLLVFFPVPYVNSSAAHRFSSKHRRIVVSAAGIMVEVFLAAIALLIWVNSEAGVLHDMAFDVLIIGGLSTLIFNANPLLRFDGYYILGELIEIPNLGTRSNQYLGYLIKRYLLDMPAVSTPVTAKGEKKWLFFYGVAAGIYRIFISLFIALWVAGKFFIVGIVLALWSMIMQIFYPAVKQFYGLIMFARKSHRIKRLSLVISLLFLLVMGGLLIPVSHSTYAEGIIKLPENALIRAGTDGIISHIQLADGAQVSAGETILTLENIELDTRRDILLARLEEVGARRNKLFLQDRTQAEIFKDQLLAIEAELNDVQLQLKNLQVSSASHGVISLPQADDLPGRFVTRGEVMGYVANLKQVSAWVVIAQSDIDAVREGSKSIRARLKSRPDEIMTAHFLREIPQATDRLPSRLLGSGAGGDVMIDARDDTGIQAISNIFQVEIALPVRHSGQYLGQSVNVRFIHQRASLGSRLLRRLSQFMLQAPFV